jgi:hypothetical protein
MLNHRRVVEICDNEPQSDNAYDPGDGLEKHLVGRLPVNATVQIAVTIVITAPEHGENGKEHINGPENNNGKQQQEQYAERIVLADLALHSYIFHVAPIGLSV